MNINKSTSTKPPSTDALAIELIVAMDKENGIGLNGTLPWKLSSDMTFFKEKTSTTKSPNKTNAVIMGRKTYDSIPEKFRPLPNRQNIILSRNQHQSFTGCHTTTSLESAISFIHNQNKTAHTPTIETLFIIGGGEIYKEAIEKNICTRLWITQINSKFNCTTHFPKIPQQFSLTHTSESKTENDIDFNFLEYTRI